MASRKPKMLVKEMVWLAPDELKRYPDNPRIGNKKELAKILRANGYAKVLTVQESTHYVLDGNHTHQCATELGIEKFPCILVDVTDEQAAKMVMGFNRAGDMSGYDPERLARVAEVAGTALGTGYTTVDFDILQEAAAGGSFDMDMLQDVMRPNVDMVMTESGALEPVVAKPKRRKKKEAEEEEEPGPLEEADDDLWGSITLKLKDDFNFETVGGWGFPRLHDDMLVQPEDIPDNLKAWAGSATRNYEDDEQWWMYNVGIDSTSGIRDMTKVILAFYAYDHYFDGWWQFPERWVAKAINSGVSMSVTPDWSWWANKPKIEGFYNLYRQRWIGRYMQDAGLRIIPNVSVPHDVDLFDMEIRTTLPDELPVICMQLQAFDREITDQEWIEDKRTVRHVIEKCDAQLTMIYAGFKGMQMIRELQDEGMTQTIKLVEARRIALDKQALGRRKKKTL